MNKKLLLPLLLCCLLTFVSVSAETLNVGTSAEYRPFVYYNFDSELTGLDIDILNEISSREGFSFKLLDMAFDGLIDSASVGQIDLICGGYSKTAEREKELLFSNVYYKNASVLIASKLNSIPDAVTLEDLSDKRIAVQRGSSFDQWLKTNLVSEGLINTQNIYTFSTIDGELKALKNGTVDLVMLDADTYKQSYEKYGDFKIVNDTIGQEEYAFAAAPGSEDLINRINSGLDKMIADGTLETILNKYAEGTGEEADFTISRPSQIQTAPIIVPTPTPIPPYGQPANCKNVLVYMADVTYPDGTKVNPGTEFTKTWRVYNNGSCKWYEGYTIEFVDGDYMSSTGAVVPQLTIPGTTVDVPMKMKAPEAYGSYTGYYQMRAPDGTFFGPKLTATIIVTNEQVSAPAAGAPPVITRFQPNYYKGGKKFCPTVYWTVTDASQIRISINNKPVYTTTNGSGSVELCPPGGRGDYTYGIVAVGTKTVSYVFNYTNTGQ